MVDVNGQIKTIRFLRTKMMFGFFICVIAVLSTLVIGQMYLSVVNENKTLYEKVAIQKAIFGEKGIIRMPCHQPTNTYDLPHIVDHRESFRQIFSEPYQFNLPINFDLSQSIDIIPDVLPDTTSNVKTQYKVRATDVKMLINHKNNRIGFSFILRNAVKAKKPISGTSFIVLKNDHNAIAYPSIKLRHHRPVSFRKGRPFYVVRFKTVRHRLDDLEHFQNFTEAMILVYSKHGHLLVDKSFPIHLSL
jgi:hypothetical protein